MNEEDRAQLLEEQAKHYREIARRNAAVEEAKKRLQELIAKSREANTRAINRIMEVERMLGHA